MALLQYENTAFLDSCDNGKVEIASLLLARGANINETNEVCALLGWDYAHLHTAEL